MIQVNDTVRAVHTAGLIRTAFFAHVLSVQQPLPDDIGTNGEPTITIGFMDTEKNSLLGGPDWHKAFKRVTTVRHVSHDEAQTGAVEYCYTEVLPSDGGPVHLQGLDMDADGPPAEAADAPETIGTIVYINHNNGLEVFHGGENMYRVHFEGEDFDFSDLLSAQVFVDAKKKPDDAPTRISGSPMHLVAARIEKERMEKLEAEKAQSSGSNAENGENLDSAAPAAQTATSPESITQL